MMVGMMHLEWSSFKFEKKKKEKKKIKKGNPKLSN
jgi:hypothetical protein